MITVNKLLTVKQPLSDEYLAGFKKAELYAKQDAISDKCFYSPVLLDSQIMKNTNKHMNAFKQKKNTDFINGFLLNYQKEYREYINLYCDNDNSSYEKEYETNTPHAMK